MIGHGVCTADDLNLDDDEMEGTNATSAAWSEQQDSNNTIFSENRFRCHSPAHEAGNYNVTLTMNSGKLGTEAFEFYYDLNDQPYMVQISGEVTHVTPALGSLEGGTLLTIHGHGFSSFADTNEVTLNGDIPCAVQSWMAEPTKEVLTCLTGSLTNSSSDPSVLTRGQGAVLSVYTRDDGSNFTLDQLRDGALAFAREGLAQSDTALLEPTHSEVVTNVFYTS